MNNKPLRRQLLSMFSILLLLILLAFGLYGMVYVLYEHFFINRMHYP